MKTWTILAIMLMALVFGKTANATDAWMMLSHTCTIYTVAGTVDDATHSTDYSPAYGRYTTTTNNGTSYLQCPVWLPHRTNIDTLKFRATDPATGDNCVVAVYLYRQHSIYATTTPTSADYVLLTPGCDTNYNLHTTIPFITPCYFTPETVCNYNDGVAPCNDDKNVNMYYAIVGIKSGDNFSPKIYNIWVGDPPVSSSEFYENYKEPVDCGWVMEKYYEGLEITEEEKGCFIMYEMSMP